MLNGQYVCWPCGNDAWAAGREKVEQSCTLAGFNLSDMLADPVQQYPAFLLVGFICNIYYCWCDVTNTHDCLPPSLVKWHVCWFSTTLLNTCDVKDVGYDELVALHGRCSGRHLNRYACIVLPRRDTKETTCLPRHITMENSGLCQYAVCITRNTTLKK